MGSQLDPFLLGLPGNKRGLGSCTCAGGWGAECLRRVTGGRNAPWTMDRTMKKKILARYNWEILVTINSVYLDLSFFQLLNPTV